MTLLLALPITSAAILQSEPQLPEPPDAKVGENIEVACES